MHVGRDGYVWIWAFYTKAQSSLTLQGRAGQGREISICMLMLLIVCARRTTFLQQITHSEYMQGEGAKINTCNTDEREHSNREHT